MSGGALAACFSEAEQCALWQRLSLLLGRQTKRYLAGDSTSLPVDTAQELLSSLLYTLRLALSREGLPERDLLTCDLSGLLLRGQRALQGQLAGAKRLWQRARLTAPSIPNSYYSQTLDELGRFFRRYDLWYFAHQIPCSIDYPLCLPVPETLQGVSYVARWLGQLLTENWLLDRFPAEPVTRLLSQAAPDYWDCPLNLCEQPLLNAVGLALLDRPVTALPLSVGDCARLADRLSACPDLASALNRAAARASEELAAPEEAGEYLRAVAARARPRLQAALSAGSLEGFFLS